MNEVVPGKKDKVTGVHEQGQVDVLVGDATLKPGRLNLKQTRPVLNKFQTGFQEITNSSY